MPFMHHVGAGLLQVMLQARFLPAVLAGAAVILLGTALSLGLLRLPGPAAQAAPPSSAPR